MTETEEASAEIQPQDEAVAAGEHIDFEALEESSSRQLRGGAQFASAIEEGPSAKFNPYLTEEDQEMEMAPAVVGPPAYGSPDPLTSAGKLVPIEQHPLNAEVLPEETPAAIAEGYGDPGTPAAELAVEGAEGAAENGEDVNATSGAQELAAAEGVDLADVEGTGEGGRVTKADVEKYVAEQNA